MLGPLAAAVLAALAFAAVGVGDIDRYHRIDERVAIGAQPTPPQLAALAEAGFHAVLNLREESEFDGEPEALAAKDAGLLYLRVPVSSKGPSDAAVEEFLHVTDDAGIYPLFVHCATANRSAALWMVRRVLRDGWTREAAETEAAGAGLTSVPMRDFARDYIRRHAPGKGAAP
jgi:uncharacterized protein (TIGR01244 family)